MEIPAQEHGEKKHKQGESSTGTERQHTEKGRAQHRNTERTHINRGSLAQENV